MLAAMRLGGSSPAENHERPNQRHSERTPQGRSEECQPREEDEGGAEVRHEQPITPRRLQLEDAAPWGSAGREILPDAHREDRAEDVEEEGDRHAVPRHPAAQRLLPPFG